MKTTLNMMGLAWFASLLLAACSPEKYDSPEASGLPSASQYEGNISITIDPEERYAYLRFNASPAVTPVWLIDGTEYSSEFTVKKFYSREGSHTVEFRVKNASGISRDAVTRQFDMVIAEPKWVDINSDDNFWNAANERSSWRYYDDDMKTRRPDPTMTVSGRTFSFTLPQATSKRQQAMLTFETDLTIEDIAQEYDFIAVIESSTGFTARCKVYDRTDANNFLFEEDVNLKAGEQKRFFVRQTSLVGQNSNAVPITGGSGRSAKRVALRFDFGTNPDNTSITIKDIILQKHIKKS